MNECEQETEDKSATDTPRESPAETMLQLRVQPSFTYNDEDSNSDRPAAQFVMEPTENMTVLQLNSNALIHSLGGSVSPQPAVRRYYRLAQKSLDIPHVKY